jgi:hypothetical protein
MLVVVASLTIVILMTLEMSFMITIFVINTGHRAHLQAVNKVENTIVYSTGTSRRKKFYNFVHRLQFLFFTNINLRL